MGTDKSIENFRAQLSHIYDNIEHCLSKIVEAGQDYQTDNPAVMGTETMLCIQILCIVGTITSVLFKSVVTKGKNINRIISHRALSI